MAGGVAEEQEKVIRLNLNRGADRYERNKELADYAVNEGLLPHHHWGNLTALSTVLDTGGGDIATIRPEEEGAFEGRNKMPKIEEICAALKVLSEAKSRGELMMPVEVGERIGIPAFDAGKLFTLMSKRELVEKPDEKKNRYQISDKGKEFLINLPAPTPKPVHKSAAPPAAPPGTPPAIPPIAPLGSKEETTAEKKDDLAIPSQADIFRSVAEQLSISKQMYGSMVS